jgi:Rps23 Pro-64 3,4-dihydroxylase Tpa1-like proline 4-hydroxylase
MSRDLTAEFSALLAGSVNLQVPIDGLRNAYRSAIPYPHIIIDHLFSPEILDPLLDEMAETRAKQWLLVDAEQQQRFSRMRSAVELGVAGTRFVSLVHSAPFLYLLSEITGVWQLLPDPYLQGAGYASMQRGDFFNIHSDRNVAYETGLCRRLAMIVFLNKSWDPQYRGQLELWNAAATHCDVAIEPAYNRTVIFEVADLNYHGVPAPIACPDNRSRRSFIVYYHTVGIDGKFDVKPHSSIFAPNFYRRKSVLRSLARELMPPALLRIAMKWVARWRTVPKRPR